MKRPVQYSDARRILGKVSIPFWLCTNDNLRNLFSLAKVLEEVDDDTFRYHVNRDRNDFEVWIRDEVGDKELAREIARVKTKETLVRKITERVNELRKVVKKHRALLERRKSGKLRRRQRRSRLKRRKLRKALRSRKIQRKSGRRRRR
ncbi:hypothetical protein HYX10_03410 [Candidatus Woesearchaeota archaeon]|nr:hypothetical protein [Candidatus Woesearchaeota archaeon]